MKAFPGIVGEEGCGNYTYQEFADGQRVPIEHNQGMTLLDYFAGQALAGMLANPDNDNRDCSFIAADAYDQATAMLEEKRRRETANPV